MHASSRWPRVLLLAVLVVAHLVWLGQAPASAHSPISTIVLQVSGSGGDVVVTASIRYPDSDPVVGETVRAVAYLPDTAESRPLTLSETKGARGQWRGTVHATPGRWQLEVDAVRKSKGLQSIGFVVGDDGSISDVASPSPLPATVVVPGAPAEAARSGLREAPRTSATRSQLTWAVVMGVAGMLVMLVIVRRMAARPEEPAEAADVGW